MKPFIISTETIERSLKTYINSEANQRKLEKIRAHISENRVHIDKMFAERNIARKD